MAGSRTRHEQLQEIAARCEERERLLLAFAEEQDRIYRRLAVIRAAVDQIQAHVATDRDLLKVLQNG